MPAFGPSRPPPRPAVGAGSFGAGVAGAGAYAGNKNIYTKTNTTIDSN